MGKVVKTVAKVAVGAALVVFAAPIAGAIGIGAITAGTVAAVGLSLAASAALSLFVKPPKVGSATTDRLNQTIQAAAPRKIVFGETAAGNDVRYNETHGEKSDLYSLVVALASHRINAVKSYWVEDQLSWSNGSLTGKYAAGITGFRAVTEGNASNGQALGTGSYWNAASTFDGNAYLAITYKLDQKIFPSGVPSKTVTVVEGCPVYDPRRDSTVGGSGPHRANDQTTWAYRDGSIEIGRNPACALVTYLLGWRFNGRLVWGMGIPADRINFTNFITYANVCDEQVLLQAGGTETRYLHDGIYSTADSHETVISSITATMGSCKLSDVGGQYCLIGGYDDTLGLIPSFSADDIVSPIGAPTPYQWNPSPPLRETFNIARGRFANPANQYQLEEWGQIETDALADGVQRTMTIDLGGVSRVSQCQRIAKQFLLREAKTPGTFAATFGPRAFALQVGSLLYLTVPAQGWEDKLFRVQEQVEGHDLLFPMVLREEDPAIYAWDREEKALPSVIRPGPFDPSTTVTPSGLSATSALLSGANGVATSEIRLTWTPETSPRVSYIQVESRVAGAPAWTPEAERADPASGQVRFIASANGASIDIRARYQMSNGAFSPWTTTSVTSAAITIGYGSLTNQPTSLAQINSGEGTKLGGIQTGATVGATTGTGAGGTNLIDGRTGGPLLVNIIDTSVGTAAYLNGQGALATKNAVNFQSGDVANRPYALQAFSPGGGLYAGRVVYTDNGGTVITAADRQPQESGANITENRTAAYLLNSGPGAYASNLAGLNSAEGAKLSGIADNATNDRLTDTRNTNQTPDWYRSNYAGRDLLEYKDAAYINYPDGNGTSYGTLRTQIDVSNTVKQRFISSGSGSVIAGRSWVRVGTGSFWGNWQREYSELTKPFFGTDLLETDGGTAATLANFKTLLGTAAYINNQGWGATASQAQVANNDLDSGLLRIARPSGATTGGNLGYNTQGAIRIRLPAAQNSGNDHMVRFVVDIYEYYDNATQTYEIAGYIYKSQNRWLNVSARLTGGSGYARPVYFGKDGASWTVHIGTPGGAWNYPAAAIRDLQVSYASPTEAAWASGWSVGFDTGTPPYTMVVANPVAGDTIFGLNAFETWNGAVATLPNFKTAQGTSAYVAGQGPGATAADYLVLNNRTEGSVLKVPRPAGATYSYDAYPTGALIVNLPIARFSTTFMIKFVVDVYEYATAGATTYEVAGHWSAGPIAGSDSWYNVSARVIGGNGYARAVRFGTAGGNPVVIIGEANTVWSYPKASVRDVTVGYAWISESIWASGWSIGMADPAGYNIHATVANPVAGDTIFGINALETWNGAVATLPNFKTGLGTAAYFNGQSAWATYSALSPTNVANRVDKMSGTTGRFTDSRVLSTNLLVGLQATITAFPTAADQGGGTGVTITVPAFSFKVAGPSGPVTISYSSASIANRSYSTYYIVYAYDADLIGGSVTWYTTTNPDDLIGLSVVSLKGIVTPAVGGGSTTGGGGSGGGGGGGGGGVGGGIQYEN